MASPVSHQAATTIQAVVKSFCGDGVARRFSASTVGDQTIVKVANLLSETVNCSQWMDSVPRPQSIRTAQRW